jgi:hypothetical protein
MSGFAFIVPGGLDKQFYKRFRALRDKYMLTDKALIEVLLWAALCGPEDDDSLKNYVTEYKATAPSDIILPEICVTAVQSPTL